MTHLTQFSGSLHLTAEPVHLENWSTGSMCVIYKKKYEIINTDFELC